MKTPKVFVGIVSLFSLVSYLDCISLAQNFIVENFSQPFDPGVFEWISNEWIATPFLTSSVPEGDWFEIDSLDVIGKGNTFQPSQATFSEGSGSPTRVYQNYIPQFFIYASGLVEDGVNFDRGLSTPAANLHVPDGRHLDFNFLLRDRDEFPDGNAGNQEYLNYRPYEIIRSYGSGGNRITQVRYETRANYLANNPPPPLEPGQFPEPVPQSSQNIRLEGDTAYWLVARAPAPHAGRPTVDSPRSTILLDRPTSDNLQENGEWDILPTFDDDPFNDPRGFFGGIRGSQDGDLWTLHPDGRDTRAVVFQFGIQARLVPEPSATIPIIAFALCAFAIVLRKLRKPARAD